MIENRKEIGVSAGRAELAPKEARAEWQRPAWRKLSAEAAEAAPANAGDNTVLS